MAPIIATSELKITFCIFRDETTTPGLSIPHNADVSIFCDGTIFMKEWIDDPRRDDADNELGISRYRNFKDFKTFDTTVFAPGIMIENWANDNGIDLRWLGIPQKNTNFEEKIITTFIKNKLKNGKCFCFFKAKDISNNVNGLITSSKVGQCLRIMREKDSKIKISVHSRTDSSVTWKAEVI